MELWIRQLSMSSLKCLLRNNMSQRFIFISTMIWQANDVLHLYRLICRVLYYFVEEWKKEKESSYLSTLQLPTLHLLLITTLSSWNHLRDSTLAVNLMLPTEWSMMLRVKIWERNGDKLIKILNSTCKQRLMLEKNVEQHSDSKTLMGNVATVAIDSYTLS